MRETNRSKFLASPEPYSIIFANEIQDTCLQQLRGQAKEHPEMEDLRALDITPSKYKTGKTLGAGTLSVVKECVHIDTGVFYLAKVIKKTLLAGKEHKVCRTWIKKYSVLLLMHYCTTQFRDRIAILKKVSIGHQNILTIADWFETMNSCKYPAVSF